MRGGTLTLVDADGTHRYGSGLPEATMTIHDPAVYAAVLREGSVGFGRTYADGLWDCDDLTSLVRVLSRGLRPVTAVQDRVGEWLGRATDWARRLEAPDRMRDRDNVQSHYDLSNRFFALMLDETMMYSSAIFDRPGLSLAEAQRVKLDRLCTKLALGPDDHVVEIGTGWGGFAVHAAAGYGCRVTTTTISDEQFHYASKRVADAGLADRVTVLDRDYRDLTGTFDKLVSIEMIEAVDWRLHDTFFGTCADLLRGDGLMALQAITIDDRSYQRAKNGTDFVGEYIFPGSCIPSIGAITRSLARATPLTVVDLEDIGHHYVETLERWHRNVKCRREEITALGLDTRFQRLWDLYLCYCAGSFAERHISDVQMVMAMPDWRPPAVGRGQGTGRMASTSQ
jgi:cyclopropane-fatty-acyl-phospholipid synthase